LVKEPQNESESENERYSPTAPDADTNININTTQQQTLEGTSVAPAITLPPVTAAGESALHVGEGAVAQAITLGPEVVIDIETSGKSVHVDNAAIPLVSITDGPHTITLANAPPSRHILANNNITKIFHNAAFELSFLKAEGLTIAYYEDTMLMYQVLCNNEGDGKLSVAAQKFLNVTMDKTLQDAKKWNGQLTQAHVD
jgi:DNA polymerase I-like protein with 3'-5' exonuclease and polymerase domains